MFEHPLSLPVRASVTATTVVLAIVMHRMLFRGETQASRRRGAMALGGAVTVAAAFAHLDVLQAPQAALFPVGCVLGLGAAVASLFSAAARRAFDRLEDGEVRLLLSFRAIYGALVLALAALDHVPVSFGLTAGAGDLAVTWLALAMPAPIGTGGPAWARLLVHGVGLADLVVAMTLAGAVVGPWSVAHGNSMTTMPLPWVAVPLMVALNAHGIRRAASSESLGDRPQSAGGVRSALS